MSENTWPPAVPGNNAAPRAKRAIGKKRSKKTARDWAQLIVGSFLIFWVIAMAFWYMSVIPFNHAANRHIRLALNRKLAAEHPPSYGYTPAPLSPFDKWVTNHFFPQYRDAAQ